MNTKKTGNAILYFINKAKGVLGPYELSKLLYFLDSRFFMFYGRTITELEYAKLPYGPAPNNYERKLAELEADDYIISSVLENKHYPTYFKSKEFDLSVFDEEEKEILIDITKEYINKSFAKLKEITHNEKPYNMKKYRIGDIFDFDDLLDTEEDFENSLNEVKNANPSDLIITKSGKELVKQLGL